MFDISAYLDTLATQAHPAGGWGYTAGAPAQQEPTCLALLALSLQADRFGPAMTKGRESLARCGDADGSQPVANGRPEALWPTAHVLFTEACLGYPADEIERTAGRLLGLSGRIPEDPRSAEMHDIDFQLLGWAWGENNFSWAEPTAWACLALRRAGFGDHPRVAEGIRLLLDRTQETGGINYGNRRIFGRLTEPIPGPTALLLLAVQGQDHPRVPASVDYLLRNVGEDLEHLCWAKLALSLYREGPEVAALDQRIISAHHSRGAADWTQSSPVREALTALALAAGRTNYFRLGDSRGKQSAPPARPSRRRGSFAEKIRLAFRNVALEAAGNLRPLAPLSKVHIAPVADYGTDLAKVLREQYEAFRDQVPLAGKRVVLKPNLVEYHRDKVINTNPLVVAAAIELCQREGAAEVTVAEGPGHWRNVEYLVQASGLGDVLRHYRVGFVDLNHDEPVKTLNTGRLTGLDYLYLSRTIVQAEVVISLPKLKTHHWAGATLSLKNLFGTLPGICYGWPKNELHWRGIDRSIIDIAVTRTPQLAIVDAVIGMEGDGPLNGTPRHLGAIVMGSDLVAVDATCCRLMKLNPERIPYLSVGHKKKLGQVNATAIEQIGERIETLAQPFETLPQFHELYFGRSA